MVLPGFKADSSLYKSHSKYASCVLGFKGASKAQIHMAAYGDYDYFMLMQLIEDALAGRNLGGLGPGYSQSTCGECCSWFYDPRRKDENIKWHRCVRVCQGDPYNRCGPV